MEAFEPAVDLSSGRSSTDPVTMIRAYVAESFVLDEDELRPDTSLIEAGILDSTGVVEVVSYLEDTFGIELADEDLVAENLDSVARMARFVESKRAAPRSS